jgi:hypothetical protein
VNFLSGYFSGSFNHPLWRKSLTPVILKIPILTDIYIQTVYSPHSPDPGDGIKAIELWKSLRWRLWLAQWIPDKTLKNN